MINASRILIGLIILFSILSCQENQVKVPTKAQVVEDIHLDMKQAEYLAGLPLNCIQTPYPYKSGLVISKAEDLQLPKEHHPAFYGCFDWHSAVHGHWSLVYLLKTFPNISVQESARKMLNENLTQAHIEKELEYFSLNQNTKSFERTYGWAWLLKLSEELLDWEDADAQRWAANLQPLADHIAEQYLDYLPKLNYPIRVGEHTNTAFGLSFAYDYAVYTKNEALQSIIEQRAKDFYLNDRNCPINWEPSGYDFLSPCLEELDIMRKILTPKDFEKWSIAFLPELLDPSYQWAPGEVNDRADGKMVHLDGLNFSRAWCLYPLGHDKVHIRRIADEHLAHSIHKITDGEYSGEHWLGSFALYALKTKTENAQ